MALLSTDHSAFRQGIAVISADEEPSEAMATGTTGVLQPAVLAGGFQLVCRAFFRLYCRLDVEGKERLPSGPFIICSNHESHMDSVALMSASGRPFREFGLLAAKDYFFDHGLKRRCVSSLLHIIPVDRRPSANLLHSVAIAQDFLAETGGVLILYPEGTRSQTGEMAPFKRGAGLFATKLGVPVVPAWVHGGALAMPKGSVLPRPSRITVRFGHPITIASGSLSEIARRELPRQLIAAVEEQVRSLKKSAGIDGDQR
jgi:1-acyl-sn-glycerol-3-phosphate acyltransferase